MFSDNGLLLSRSYANISVIFIPVASFTDVAFPSLLKDSFTARYLTVTFAPSLTVNLVPASAKIVSNSTFASLSIMNDPPLQTYTCVT